VVTSFRRPGVHRHPATVSANITGGGANCSFNTAFAGRCAGGRRRPGVAFPDGLFQFALINCVGFGDRARHLPDGPLPRAEQYYKYGPTPGTPGPRTGTPLGATKRRLSLAGNTATFTIADGGLGDDDTAVNGTIVRRLGGPGIGFGVAPEMQ